MRCVLLNATMIVASATVLLHGAYAQQQPDGAKPVVDGETPLPELSTKSWIAAIAARQGVNNDVLRLALSPDGRWVATPTGALVQ